MHWLSLVCSLTHTHIYYTTYTQEPVSKETHTPTHTVSQKWYESSHRLRWWESKASIEFNGNFCMHSIFICSIIQIKPFAHTGTLTKRIKINWKSMFLIQAWTNTHNSNLKSNAIDFKLYFNFIFVRSVPHFIHWTLSLAKCYKCKIYNLMILCCSTIFGHF